ncbi:hypothetical protein KSS87_019552 [Heliosperma pusillum]|nr:hypothetical protein KSS87_019552 [Heliosperma pusillum]
MLVISSSNNSMFMFTKSLTCTLSLLNSPNLISSSSSSSSSLYRLRPTMFTPLRSSSSSPCSLEQHQLQHHQHQPPSPCGEVHVIVGPMFAGKTTTLLRRIQSERHLGRLRQAIHLLSHTPLPVHSTTYALLLQECIHRGAFNWGKRIHAHTVLVGFPTNDYLNIKLLILYAKVGELTTAHILFHSLPYKTLVSWNAIIAGYVQKRMEDVGLTLYYSMRQSGLIPDQFTFASVFRACASLALLEQGKQVHAVMFKCRIGQNVVVNSALMDMYFKCSCLFDGHKVFDKSQVKNVITWTSLISGYGHNGKIVEVFQLFHEMIKQGLRPNYVTFLALLSACSHGGLVDQGWKYFSSMRKDYGIQPHEKHYAVMVDLLGRAGRLGDAYNFINCSPCKENPVVWGSLLGACRTHGNVELLKLSAKKFFDLEPENAGKYVVLSNSYASYGLWGNVAEVWGLMRDFGVKKDPGYSKIEIQNEVHVFFKGDNTHGEAENTYQMLSELTRVIKDKAYTPENIALIKSDKDTRYELNSVVTHDGNKYPCWALHNLSSFRQKIGPSAYNELDVIGIDEAQFFEDLYDFCQTAADNDGKTIIVAGLDGDYLRRSFGSVLDIIPLADSVTKLTARCNVCGKLANFTLRKTEETDTEVIGGAEVYMPVCRKHYISGQVVIEAARHVLKQKVQCG